MNDHKQNIGANPAQYAAITHKTGPAVVLAGPGSGKTFVITQRLRFLIERLKIDPSRILTITFTRAAAAQMRRRFSKLTENRYPETVFGTFHSIFYRIIQTSLSGTEQQIPRIISDKEKTRLLQMVLADLHETHRQLIPSPDLIDLCLTEISRLKGGGKTAESTGGAVGQELCFPEIFAAYQKLLDEAGLLDYDDILLRCRDLLRDDPRILAQWQQRFPFVQIDEYQDINPIQFETIRMLAGEEQNLFVVGDDDQSIYGFRGSDPSIMLRFSEFFPGAATYALETNYRCRPSVLKAADCVIRENSVRFEKQMRPGRTDESGLVQMNSFKNNDEEFAALSRFAGEQGKDADLAVIVRNNAQGEHIREAMAANGIRVRETGRRGPSKEITEQEDICAYLRLSSPVKRQADFYRIMNRPVRYLSRECVRSDPFTLTEAQHYYLGRRSMLETLQKLFRDLDMLARMRPALAIRYIRTQMGYDAYIRQNCTTDPKAAFDRLDALQREAGAFPAHALFLKSLAQKAEEETSKAPSDSGPDGVRILTMHASKGLEFDTVWLPMLNEGILPARRIITPEAIEEERRLLYVAMTRARRTLILSWVTGDSGYVNLPSRFLRPLHPD